ncbi:MAG: ATP-dependent DNA helicase RecG [Methylomonas sp.]|nr:ATP-dependent DNA helicase RecG [Methylomonas sp.]PPD20327.1 MAG: ATP-dependent DNA helicase RecG [Methylomonas sp.]PPD26628.1 MAG: ATP-dependent DNA helicase RecG [Methylomonas sp.]PPD38415.1 MAG: ATP-dependent DNA helicase RecG [Methylomonas sp.]PPD40428.1 MAG: ATP-dependent DNA helicase RecG [Methylomonas sp.]
MSSETPPFSAARQPVTRLSGIGAQTASRLEKLGLRCLEDLLFHLPQRYQDRTRIVAIAQLVPGQHALISATVEFTDTPQRGRPSILCRVADGSGHLALRFFHVSAQQLNNLKPGAQIWCYGEVRSGFNGLEMIHPEYRLLTPDEDPRETGLTPVYPLTEGLGQSTLRKAIKQALERIRNTPAALPDFLPQSLIQRQGYPSLIEALSILHSPPPELARALLDAATAIPALQRLAFEEFLAHHLALLQGKLHYRRWRAPPMQPDHAASRNILARLPFQLTAAQQRVIAEIEADLIQPRPMLRLVQGDVGCGKTLVAAVSALTTVQSGYQVALMAPTELLAEQHYRNFSLWFTEGECRTALLTGQIKASQRKHTLDALAVGAIDLIIGTHALFQDAVVFGKLGLVIIDEQHRFGVQQRLALRQKGERDGQVPHQLVMTATPIPRTLAMLQYSDLDMSVIDELPPGRKPVITRAIATERRIDIIERLKHWIAEQRQAYWVCTLIEESEQLQCEAAEKTAVFLAEQLPDARIALVHGRMKAADKNAAMQAFKNGEHDLLVATTVIEVGVDVANAGLMVIENAERLGLAQLHQLRGRVGRGSIDSFCLLLYQPPLSFDAKQRLAILRESNDGFLIAEKDLALRGPGEVIGNRQTGQIAFKIADLTRDQALLAQVADAAHELLQQHPDVVQPLIERWTGHQADNADHLFKTAYSP